MATKWVGMSFKLPVTYKKKAKWYVAACPVLDVVTQGTTKKKAETNLKEALSLFFEYCIEEGTLDEVLKQSGFTPIKTDVPKNRPAGKGEYINIPIPFLVKPPKNQPCHA